MFVVDASVWAAHFMPHDAHHDASLAWIEAQVETDEVLVVPTVALAEVSGAIARRTGSSQNAERATDALQRFRSVTLVEVDTPLASVAARIASRQRLRGVDAIYAAIAHQLEVPLVTWDREQRERASAIVTASEPSKPAPR